MSRRSERIRIKQMGVGTLRTPIGDATEEEVAESTRSANDDGGITPNSTERIALNGNTTKQSHVNLIGKKGMALVKTKWKGEASVFSAR